MKSQHKISLIILLFFSLGTVIAQEKFNHKNQQKNTVVIKFYSTQTTALDKAQKNTSEKGKMRFYKQYGYVKTGITDIDKCNRKLKTTSMKRVFRHAGKFEEKHRKSGLHLWYEITYDHTITVDDAIDLYKKSNQIETAHARYKAELSDGYSNKSQAQIVPISENTPQPIAFKANNFSGAPNDPDYAKQWHYNNTGQNGGTSGSDIKLEKAWDIEKGDSRVIVAIMDEPVQVDHPDLKRNMWINENEIPGNEIDDDNNGYIDDVNGYDYVRETGNIIGMEHGTHVAGTVAAETNNGVGVAGVAGGTGNGDGVRIMSCAILGFGVGGLEESYVYAADHGAVISQNSWSLHAYPYDNQSQITATKAGIDYFIANAGGPSKAMNGGIVVFAMGNDNHEYNDSYPDSNTSVFHVGSTNYKDKKSSFSNFGTWGEIFAPGGGKEQLSDPKEVHILSTLHNSAYGYLSGTSMATPHVSGVAALVISHNYGNITPSQVKAVLQGSSDSIDHLNPDYIDKLGSGRLNALNALTYNIETIPLNITQESRTETSIVIKWNNIISANSYEIRYKATGQANWITISDINTNAYNVQGLNKATEYHFQVRSKEASETSLYSERKIFWTDLINPEIPTNIRVTEKRPKNATINWDTIDHASAYEISYKKAEDQEWIIFLSRKNYRGTLINLSEGASYQARVRAIYGDIYSNYSNVANFITGNPVCSDFEPWDPNKVYPGTGFWVEGSLVSHNNAIYENKHWTQNQEPGVSSAWKKLFTCNGGGNLSPTVSITQPNNRQVFEQQTLSAITLSANASDPDGTIASIQFEANGTNLTQGNNISWLPPAFGNYTIKVTATDDKGATATSQIAITINEKNSNQPPIVSINQPNDGQIFEQETLSAITLSANASDTDGTIASVQFEVNNALLAQGNNISWTPPAFGNYTIKVTATDDKGATATNQIMIAVKEVVTGGDCNGISAWNPNTTYPSEGGVKVSHKNNIYQNKWWTQNNEPGTGGPWGPWELIEPCAAKKLAYSNNDDIIIFPIPVKELLQIQVNHSKSEVLKLSLHSISGKKVRTLINQRMNAGNHYVSHNISSLPKGIYILKIENENRIQVKKIIID